ncbi:hypothetical protein FH063_002241 [Azospirillum argentinense]|uniref:Uncharacterized protein n=1 Tax=Azospirillum argentinense TaxID=2970906 RepID=A0A5B0KQ35_9PROT|nr:hypothetical protein FH063_002241 [Azospirillum argentinense]
MFFHKEINAIIIFGIAKFLTIKTTYCFKNVLGSARNN